MADVKKKHKKGKRRHSGVLDVLNAMLTLVLIGLVLVAGVVLYGVTRFNADGPLAEDATFRVEQGNSLTTIAQRLDEQGFIADATTFQLAARAMQRDRGIDYGDYAISANASMSEILRELSDGTPIQYRVIIPEGFSTWQVIERVRADENLTGPVEEVPPEGSLLPGSYDYQRGDSRQSVITAMVAAMDETLADVWQGRDSDLPLDNPGELVTLASIVEKETAVPDERDEVAGVFVNRLERGMRLQSDPTIIYGINQGEGSLGRGLLQSEIDEPTPYNTYQIDGLPPGPIANPGIQSLRAAANPAETSALYFVADGSGGHAFADTYDEHRANVARWREIEAEQARAAAQAEAQAEQDVQAVEAPDAPDAETEGLPDAPPALEPVDEAEIEPAQ